MAVLRDALLGEVDVHLQSAGVVHLRAGRGVAVDDLPAQLAAIGDGLPFAGLADANRDGDVGVDRRELAEAERRGEFSRGDVGADARLALGSAVPVFARARARVRVENAVVRARLDAADFTTGMAFVSGDAGTFPGGLAHALLRVPIDDAVVGAIGRGERSGIEHDVEVCIHFTEAFLDAAPVVSAVDLDASVVFPSVTPGVLNEPVFVASIRLAPANDDEHVVRPTALTTHAVDVGGRLTTLHAAGVVHDGNRSVVHNLVHSPLDVLVLGDGRTLALAVCLSAATTLELGDNQRRHLRRIRANLAVVNLGFVSRHARLISGGVRVRKFAPFGARLHRVPSLGLTRRGASVDTAAAGAPPLTRHELLLGDDIVPSSLSLHAHAVREHVTVSESPARAALALIPGMVRLAVRVLVAEVKVLGRVEIRRGFLGRIAGVGGDGAGERAIIPTQGGHDVLRVSFLDRDVGGVPGLPLDAKLPHTERVLAQPREIGEVKVKVKVGRHPARLRGIHRRRLALELAHVGDWNRGRVRVGIGELLELDQVEG